MPDFDIIEVSIIREKGNNPIKIGVFGKIAEILMSIVEDNPEIVFFYFCDTIEEIPKYRPNRLISAHNYRNELFKLLFKRYSPEAKDHWSDVEIVLESDSPKLEFYSHLLVRDRHLPMVDYLRDEIYDNFGMISEQK